MEGVSEEGDLLIFKGSDECRVYDRICDHNGGRLSLKGEFAVCPYHGWTFDPRSGKYLDVQRSKQPLLVSSRQEEQVFVEKSRRALRPFERSYEVQVRFLNHACLVFSIDGVGTFATDPWIVGPAFCNGWWLAEPSPSDAFEVLNSCDFVYISHNHSDHLHEQSLAKIRKDMPILTAAFDSGSTVRSLKEVGFNNIIAPEFGAELLDMDHEIAISILHSGDFRDDSGLLVQAGRFTALLTVDSNSLDYGRLPEKVDLLCSSFAGGASGFPLCFENKEAFEQDRLVARNRAAIRATNRSCIEHTNTSYFMPYAGFFVEKADRDEEIRKRNVKNKITDYADVCGVNDVQLLNVQEYQIYTFGGCELRNTAIDDSPRLEDQPPESYIEFRNASLLAFEFQQIESYFSSSNFFDQLVLKVKLTDEDFDVVSDTFVVEFDDVRPPKVVRSGEIDEDKALELGKRYLSIRVREFEFKHVVLEGKPWEDLSIGFQMRVYRQPDIYNSRFWDHFSNVYISDNVATVR